MKAQDISDAALAVFLDDLETQAQRFGLGLEQMREAA